MLRVRPEEDQGLVTQVEEESVLSRANGMCKGSEAGR